MRVRECVYLFLAPLLAKSRCHTLVQVSVCVWLRERERQRRCMCVSVYHRIFNWKILSKNNMGKMEIRLPFK